MLLFLLMADTDAANVGTNVMAPIAKRPAGSK